MTSEATQPIEDFLSENQIKKHKLQGYTCFYSLLACDKSNDIGLIDRDGISSPVYITRQKSGKYIVKY